MWCNLINLLFIIIHFKYIKNLLFFFKWFSENCYLLLLSSNYNRIWWTKWLVRSKHDQNGLFRLVHISSTQPIPKVGSNGLESCNDPRDRPNPSHTRYFILFKKKKIKQNNNLTPSLPLSTHLGFFLRNHIEINFILFFYN